MSFIENNNLFIGGHIGFSKNMLPTIEDAVKYDMKSVQFFLGNPKSFTRQRLQKEDIIKSYNLTQEYMMNVFSHYPYTCSLCGSVACLAWNGNNEQDEKTTKILKELEYELNTMAEIADINGVVIHPGSFKNTNDGLETISKSINKINFNKNAKLLLENSAAEGTKLCKNFKELAKVFEGIDSSKRDNVGCCIDTAHIWGSGIYNLSKRDEIDKMFHEFDKYIGLEKFDLLHLNDSAVPFASKKDRHECLKYGYIWKEDDESLQYLLTKCSENNIPVILETPNVLNDMESINNF
jgi:deoxyribonuclease-4